jgi:hypothetical protein
MLALNTTNPSPNHRDAATHLLHYVDATDSRAIEYSLDGIDLTTAELSDVLVAMSDASFGDDPETRYSSQGFVIKLFNGPIAWQATKQSTVTTSTTEAELLSITNMTKELLRIMRVFQCVVSLNDAAPTIITDNQQTAGLLSKTTPLLATKLRHVDIHQHWLRQEVQKGRIKVTWIDTNSMIADGMTKTLSAQKHQEFVKMLNLVDIPNLINKSAAIRESAVFQFDPQDDADNEPVTG